MRLFAIDTENTITAFPAAEQIPEGQEHFASEKELAKVAADWPADRLVRIWNSFAGVAGFGGDLKPVKKFTDRKTAVARIWGALQKLDAATESEAAATKHEAATRAPRAAKGAPKQAKANPGSQGQEGRAHGARGRQEGSRPGFGPTSRRRGTPAHHGGQRQPPGL